MECGKHGCLNPAHSIRSLAIKQNEHHGFMVWEEVWLFKSCSLHKIPR